VSGLASPAVKSAAAEKKGRPGPPLRVGITPEYPPLVFLESDVATGLEIDFAKALGLGLNRPVEFVILKWNEQIPALLERRTDIIMSGMSITQARRVRIAFTEPYVHNQLRAIFRREDATSYATPQQLLTSSAKIGFLAGTTSDTFVTQNCPNAQRVPISLRRDVRFWLVEGRRIDVFIDDTFSLALIFSENEAPIAYLQLPLSEEELAWGVRNDDPEFLAAVNHSLAAWKSDGTSDQILEHWIPYYKKYKSK